MATFFWARLISIQTSLPLFQLPRKGILTFGAFLGLQKRSPRRVSIGSRKVRLTLPQSPWNLELTRFQLFSKVEVNRRRPPPRCGQICNLLFSARGEEQSSLCLVYKLYISCIRWTLMYKMFINSYCLQCACTIYEIVLCCFLSWKGTKFIMYCIRFVQLHNLFNFSSSSVLRGGTKFCVWCKGSNQLYYSMYAPWSTTFDPTPPAPFDSRNYVANIL